MMKLATNGDGHNGLPAVVTEKDVAAWLGVHPKTVWLWTRQGKFPRPFRLAKVRSSSYWLASDVNKWAVEKSREAQAA